MVLKIRHLAFVLLLAMLFSGVVSGADVQILDWITIKEIDPFRHGDLGHYWIEMLDENGNVESYGWYPSVSEAESSTLGFGYVTGVRGELNGYSESYAKMKPEVLKHDLAEGHTADREYHPILTNSQTNQQIRDSIRKFAKGYSGNWALGTRDCHTFLKELMETVGLDKPSSNWFISTAYAPSSEVGAPLLPPPTSDTPSNDGSGVSDIGKPLIGDNNPEKAPTEAEFPRPYDPDLPCI